MSSIAFPAELLPAQWEKIKGLPEEDLGVGDALKKLRKLHEAVDLRLLDSAKLKTSDELEERLDDLQGELKGKAKAAIEQGKAVATLVGKFVAALKKKPAVPKPAVAAADKAGDAATQYAADLGAAFVAAMAELRKELPKLLAAEAKEAQDEADGGDFAKFAAPRVVAAMRQVRKADANAKPVLFMIVEGNKHAAAYLGPSVSPGYRKKLVELLKARGDTSFKSFRGSCVWEQKSYTFVGDNVPMGGFAKKLKEGLAELTGVKYKLRLRRTSGEVDEIEGDVDEEGDVDALLAAATARAPSTATTTATTTAGTDEAAAASGRGDAAGKEAFNARLVALQPRIQAGLSGPAAAALKPLVAELKEAAQHERYAQGEGVLDRIQAALDGTAGFDEAAFRKRWNAAVQGWQDAVEKVDAQIGKLQAVLKQQQDEELEEIAEYGLPAVTANLKTPMVAALLDIERASSDGLKQAARRADAAAGAFATFLDADARIRATDENEFGTTVTVRSSLGAALREMRSVLALAV